MKFMFSRRPVSKKKKLHFYGCRPCKGKGKHKFKINNLKKKKKSFAEMIENPPAFL